MTADDAIDDLLRRRRAEQEDRIRADERKRIAARFEELAHGIAAGSGATAVYYCTDEQREMLLELIDELREAS
jgi:hypothetical protein